MRIALCLYPIDNWGGIINHVEDLAYGLRAIGHSMNLHMLVWQNSVVLQESDTTKFTKGQFGYYNQHRGWLPFPGFKIPYKGEDNLKRACDFLSAYDLIIWEIPVPTARKENKGNTDWIKLYKACGKNIAMIHDGNLVEGYPWLYMVKDHLTGLACVHECAYGMAANLSLPRALLLNPQRLDKKYIFTPYERRQCGFLSLQTFKGWKHVDQLVRAIPYIDYTVRKVLAGGGLEQQYMISKDKIKPEYLCRRKEDPNLPFELEQRRTTIWNRALAHNMEWLGYTTNRQRDKLLLELRCLVDPSWSIRYAKAGGHFNRTVIDALKCGALPVATRIGMEGFTGSNLFKEGVNYIGLDYDCTPSQYASQVEQACNLPNRVASTIIDNGRKLLARFECKTVAQQFIDFATTARSYDTGREDSGKLVTKAYETYADFFMPKTNIRDFL